MGLLLGGVVGGGLIVLGLAALAFPRQGATLFGVPTAEPTALAYVRACAARDVAAGAMLALVTAFGGPGAIAGALAGLAVIPLADFVLVLSRPERRSVLPLLLHGAGALAMAAAAWVASGG